MGSPTFRTGLLAGGVTVLSIGAIAVGTGIFLWASNGTNIQTEQAASAKPKLRFTPYGIAF